MRALLVVLLVAGCARRAAPVDDFVNPHPDAAACERDPALRRLEVPRWDGGGVLGVRYLGAGGAACPARHFPVVAADAPGLRWLQVDGRAPREVPFVGDGGKLWDNRVGGTRPSAGEGVRRFIAHTYAVVPSEHALRAVGGFSWGWEWGVDEALPHPVLPSVLPPSAWAADAALLARALPGWRFE